MPKSHVSHHAVTAPYLPHKLHSQSHTDAQDRITLIIYMDIRFQTSELAFTQSHNDSGCTGYSGFSAEKDLPWTYLAHQQLEGIKHVLG